jgi:4-amino-4-deoxy-L-arabinose transferase-like glycosyltransferase
MDRRLELLAIALVATAFRLPRIGSESFWQDEVLTSQSATAPIAHVLAIVRQSENAPPLYFYLINLWATAFGSSDAALRVPSALAGIASVVVIARLGGRLFGDFGHGAGLWAAAMLAVQPYHIAYSMEARPYALAFLLALWSCETLAVTIARPTRKAQILYVASTAAMLWTHTFFGLVCIAQNLVTIPLLLAGKAHKFSLRNWLVLQGAVLILLAPWVHETLYVYRMGAPWITRITLWQTLLTYSGNVALLGLWLGLSVLAVIVGERRFAPGIGLAVAIWVVPVMLPLGIAAFDRPLFVPRYAIASLIGVHLLCGFAAAWIQSRQRLLGILAGSAVILAGLWVSAPLLVHGKTLLAHDDVRSASHKIDELARPGDAVWSTSVHYWPAFDRYCSRRDLHRVVALSELHNPPAKPQTLWMLVEASRPDPAVDGYHQVSSLPYDGLRLVRADRTAAPKAE